MENSNKTKWKRKKNSQQQIYDVNKTTADRLAHKWMLFTCISVDHH